MNRCSVSNVSLAFRGDIFVRAGCLEDWGHAVGQIRYLPAISQHLRSSGPAHAKSDVAHGKR
jgi:hypothetical protein